jgi:hypothetical protein
LTAPQRAALEYPPSSVNLAGRTYSVQLANCSPFVCLAANELGRHPTLPADALRAIRAGWAAIICRDGGRSVEGLFHEQASLSCGQLDPSITMRHVCSISARLMWNGSCCTRIVRPEHIHNKANSIGSGYVSEDHAFSSTIVDAGAVLVMGPANTKSKLVKYISQHDPYRDSARALAQWIASACRASGLVVKRACCGSRHRNHVRLAAAGRRLIRTVLGASGLSADQHNGCARAISALSQAAVITLQTARTTVARRAKKAQMPHESSSVRQVSRGGPAYKEPVGLITVS